MTSRNKLILGMATIVALTSFNAAMAAVEPGGRKSFTERVLDGIRVSRESLKTVQKKVEHAVKLGVALEKDSPKADQTEIANATNISFQYKEGETVKTASGMDIVNDTMVLKEELRKERDATDQDLHKARTDGVNLQAALVGKLTKLSKGQALAAETQDNISAVQKLTIIQLRNLVSGTEKDIRSSSDLIDAILDGTNDMVTPDMALRPALKKMYPKYTDAQIQAKIKEILECA